MDTTEKVPDESSRLLSCPGMDDYYLAINERDELRRCISELGGSKYFEEWQKNSGDFPDDHCILCSQKVQYSEWREHMRAVHFVVLRESPIDEHGNWKKEAHKLVAR